MLGPERKAQFARLYDEEIARVFGFFAYRVGGRAQAEDLTQQTFERALRAWDRFDPDRASPATWLFSIARNLLVDHFRRDRFDEVVRFDTTEDGHGIVNPATRPADNELSADIATALGDLTPQEREVIALRFGGSMKGPEIAELTGKSLANVHQIQSRAMRKLRDALAKDTSEYQPVGRTA
jgi:RNA polymerase sigma-70 factor (ECF subfamily)